VAERTRLGLLNASQVALRAASQVALHWRPEAHWAESQHAAALLREEELPQSSAAEPAALAL
jgi:hypothetical protein